MINPRVIHTGEEQLEAVANKILDKILLSPGNPSDWGSDIHLASSQIKSFGLAKRGGKPYELDIDKVIRLNVSGKNLPENLTINPIDVLRSLGLSEEEYGLRIRIIPTINASLKYESNYIYEIRIYITSEFYMAIRMPIPSDFYINLTDYGFRRVANANLTITYTLNYVEILTEPYYRRILVSNITYAYTISNWRGSAQACFEKWLEKTLKPNPHNINIGNFYNDLNGVKIPKEATITLLINHYTLKNMYAFHIPIYVWGTSSIRRENASMIGRYIFIPKKIMSYDSNVDVTEIIPPHYSFNVEYENIDELKDYYRLNLSYVDPYTTSIVIAIIPRNSPSDADTMNQFINKINTTVVDVSPILVFETSKPSLARRVVVGRIVEIARYTYYFEFTLWRREEG